MYPLQHPTQSKQPETKEEEAYIHRNGPSLPFNQPPESLMPKCRALEFKRKRAVLQIARETTPNSAINTIYHHYIDIIHIDLLKNCFKGQALPVARQYASSAETNLTHYAPMIKKKRPLPIFKKDGFTPGGTHLIARSAIECVCCEVCFLLALNLKKLSHPLMICTSVISATELTKVTTGYKEYRLLYQKNRDRKLTKLMVGHAQLVLT